ncbi:MAG: hypothetical protein M3N13_03295 [Candidatus Eremiobacteraeota bacterium]|nr:hypothetical protein [Candidatus Eremiobacteraeota bacterium]
MSDAELTLRAALERAFYGTREPLGARELFTVSLASHEATGFTIHRRGNEVMPKPASLSILQIGSDPGFYLVYLDGNGDEQTDTYHGDLDSAFAQAGAEFGVARTEWQSILPEP